MVPIRPIPHVVTRDPSVVFEVVDVPCPGPLHLSHVADYVYYDKCPLSQRYVGPSDPACDVEHTSFHFGHSWQHTGVVHLSLQADGKVAFKDIGVWRMPPSLP